LRHRNGFGVAIEGQQAIGLAHACQQGTRVATATEGCIDIHTGRRLWGWCRADEGIHSLFEKNCGV
jgi:hypothetical protein